MTEEQRKIKRRRRRRRRKKRQRGGIISNLILIVAFAVFFVSAFQLIRIAKGYMDGRSEYEKVRDLAITADEEEEDEFRVDFDKLLEINPDTIGWIRFSPEPSVISYPIVQGDDNEEYLHKTFSANENTLGAIFLGIENASDFNDRHSIIYGHRMKDGSMFRHLQDYEEKAFWEENPYFYIYTLDGRKITYEIYAAEQILETSETYRVDFADDEEYQQFLKNTAESSIYQTGTDLENVESVVTLSTCTSASDEHRFVVRGAKIKEEQQ